ncbi:MAG: amidohydrolase family protein, partial [Coriobacteriales bacterium]|nr:amidohydrolase family protein [Coriobacteriales bacterium]
MKKSIGIILLLTATLAMSFALVFASGCGEDKTADLVVYGNIYTAEQDNGGMAEAFAVKDGKYVYVGDKQGAKAYVKEGKTEVVDRTNEGLIIPGATEGHSHYFGVFGAGAQLPAHDCTYKEMLEVIKEQVQTQYIKFFTTWGWKTNELVADRDAGKNFAEEIEQVAPGIPVVLLDNSGHSAVCNTTALKKAGLLDNPQLRGAEIYLDKNGKPSGFVSDQGVGYLSETAIGDALSVEQSKKACKIAMDTLLKQGYTSALDAYINQFSESSLSKALNEMDKAGELKVNVASCYNLKSYDADKYKEKVDHVADLNNQYKSTHYNPAFIKLFADGVVESKSGWISEEYKNAEKGKEHGNIIWEPQELNDLTAYANSKDILIHTHSYGDMACKTMIEACIYSNKENGKEYRNCIGHARNIQAEDKKRAAENNIPIAENLMWHADFDTSTPEGKAQQDAMLSRMSEDLYFSGYPMKSLLDAGVTMSSSTDAPAAATIE